MEVLWQPKTAFHSASWHVVIFDVCFEPTYQTTSWNYKEVDTSYMIPIVYRYKDSTIGIIYEVSTYKEVWFHQTRLSQSPSLFISGSGSWLQREGLLSPAARQIYRRNFPPVGFIQSRKVLLIRRQSNPIAPHEMWLKVAEHSFGGFWV